MEDLPLELKNPVESPIMEAGSDQWEQGLQCWSEQFLQSGREGLHTCAEAMFEKVLINSALKASHNHRQKAAVLLGWGRNTLTRKIQSLGMEE